MKQARVLDKANHIASSARLASMLVLLARGFFRGASLLEAL
jgi:hypothetical protein